MQFGVPKGHFKRAVLAASTPAPAPGRRTGGGLRRALWCKW